LRNKLFQTGHPVEKMKRVGIANIELGALAPGGHRELSPGEVAGLTRALDGERPATLRTRQAKRPIRKHSR